MKPKVSVIISNRNDVAMLAVTVRSCIESFKTLPFDAEIVVADNSDAEAYEMVKGALPVGYCRDGILKIHRQDFPCLFSARELAATKAVGDYILCLDSHMLVGNNMIADMVSFMDRYSSDPTLGFAHAPVCWAHHHEKTSRHDRDMSVNELGDWNKTYDYERPITWKGMPWICKRSWFLDKNKGLNGYGALSEHFVSWGGGDMHIGIKPWLLGFKNWAVPTSPGIHIGPFPKVDKGNDGNSTAVADFRKQNKYRLYGKSGNFPHTFGFLVSCYVLGGEEMMKRNEKAITDRFGKFIDVRKWWHKAIELGQNERKWLSQRQVMTFEQLLTRKPWDEQEINVQAVAN